VSKGRSLELFFIDGRPDGMLTAEVFNWTGHVLRIPRTQIKTALARAEARYTGVYLLLGEAEGRDRLYIGEAEDMAERLRSHAINKDWWDTAVLITTAANVLNKAHVKYLESRLVEIARDVGAAELDNGNTPTRSSLSESATSNMEAFIETTTMVLPAIRIDAFLSRRRVSPLVPTVITDDPRFELRLPRHNVRATAVLRNGEMIVEAGSIIRAAWVGKERFSLGYQKVHSDILASGLAREQDGAAVLLQDVAFASPSAAAAVVSGRSANGRISWVHVPTGVTFAQWEESQLMGDTA
jgi:hypothetical protein